MENVKLYCIEYTVLVVEYFVKYHTPEGNAQHHVVKYTLGHDGGASGLEITLNEPVLRGIYISIYKV